MKLELVSRQDITSDLSTLSLDNVFTTTYDDYVIYCQKIGGTGSSINMRLLNTSGTEQSDSKYDFHQIYYSSGDIAYQRTNNQNRVYDFLWKGDNASMKVNIFGPMLATQTRGLVQGVRENTPGFWCGFNYTDNTEQHRGIKFYQQGASDAFDEGSIAVYGIVQ